MGSRILAPGSGSQTLIDMFSKNIGKIPTPKSDLDKLDSILTHIKHSLVNSQMFPIQLVTEKKVTLSFIMQQHFIIYNTDILH